MFLEVVNLTYHILDFALGQYLPDDPLNEDQKALVKEYIADTGTNIFEALFFNDITEFDDLLSLIEHDSSIKYL